MIGNKKKLNFVQNKLNIMISLKEWNSFTPKTRRDILETLVDHTELMFGDCLEIIDKEYHHNFNFDKIGMALKQILECCYKQPNNTIKICATIVPTYALKTSIYKPIVKKQETPKTKRYVCCYEEKVKHCEYCGKEIEDTNDTGSLCYRCYMKEYYPDEQDL